MLAVLVVWLGGWTRLNDAGLSCPDWPGCYGEWLLPSSAEQQQLLQARYPDQPLDIGRGWIEMGHRYLAGSLGMSIAVLALLAWQRRHQPGNPLLLCSVLLLLVTLQALFGMWTVTLKLLPQVVTLHLLGGLLSFALLLRLNLRLNRSTKDAGCRGGKPRSAALRYWLWVLGLLLGVQIGLGGWTSANYAGWSCSHWLSCELEQSPTLDFKAGFSLPASDGTNYLGGQLSREGRAAIQISHRIMALLVTLAVLLLAWRLRHQPGVRFWTTALLAAVVAQLLLGVSNILLALPLSLAFAHHALALVLVALLVVLYSRVEE
jgi:cytochrome c oxidase assembly protein subunit 15